MLRWVPFTVCLLVLRALSAVEMLYHATMADLLLCHYLQDLSKAFARGDYGAARSSLIRLRYVRRILDAIQEKM